MRGDLNFILFVICRQRIKTAVKSRGQNNLTVRELNDNELGRCISILHFATSDNQPAYAAAAAP